MKAVNCYIPGKPLTSYVRHDHTIWEITRQTMGTATVTAGDKTFNLQTGDVIVLPPHTMHEGASESPFLDASVLATNLDFSEMFVVNDKDGSIGVLMGLIDKVMLEKEDNYQQIADNLLAAICQYIKKFDTENTKTPFVYALKKTIYDNFSKGNFNLSQAIEKTGFNSDYIRRCFKAETGKTPLEYLTSLRIEYAKSLLTRSDFISVDDTASKCGFNDSFYFSTCFKKHTGISPLQYKKRAVT